MPDRKPPRVCADERSTLTALLQFQRESMVRKLEGVDDDAARHRFVDSDTSLLWLVKHLSRAERLWVLQRFRGDAAAGPGDAVEAADTVASVVAGYRDTWAAVDAVVAGADLDEVSRDEQDLPPVNLRWILMHLLEETARHAGHADILRELLDGSTGR